MPTSSRPRVADSTTARVSTGSSSRVWQTPYAWHADGYRVTGYFIYWLSLNKDKDFIRKFNRSAVELKPWSWDKAMKHILGDKPENTTDALWQEYMKAVGD